MHIKLFRNCLFLCFLLPLLSLQAQQPGNTLLESIDSYLKKQGFSQGDVVELKVSDQYYSTSMELQHIYIQQYLMDIPVENAILNTGFKRDKLVYSNNTFARNISSFKGQVNSIITGRQGLRRAMDHLGRSNISIPQMKKSERNNNDIIHFQVYDGGTISRQDIKVSLIWVQEGKELRLCWQSIIDIKDRSTEWYRVMIDARTGEYVKKHNLVVECSFDEHNCEAENNVKNESRNPGKERALLANSYNVFDLPLESPNHGSRTITSSPWTRAGVGNPASTNGWHNDGSSAYTITRGNNVFAYEDQDNDNNPGASADGGMTLDFNFPLDFGMPPTSNMDASITNLFHTCNLVHDILYQYGFDEGAGNFQNDNLGRGGTGGDHVLAEAFDGSGTNNANFATPPDGESGRMQMFLWNSTPPPTVTVNIPAGLSSPMYAHESSFSTMNGLFTVGPVTGDVVLVDDGTGSPTEACNALINGSAVNGNIALIDRGNCDFVIKVKNAQDAGAIAAIVVNNNPGQNPIVMGGSDNTITIPAVMISYEHGLEIKTALGMAQVVNMTLEGEASIDLDGSFDNGIVIHEYGHGVSNRLTGGPAAAGCLQNDEQMGEGWSDFLTLMLTTDWSAAMESENRGIGTYAIAEPTSGTGIRTYPYSTNMIANPFTYADVADAPLGQFGDPSPHYIGTIWATMLWDMTWNIIDITPIDPDIYHGNGGNNIALQLVMDGMKLQPCSPGFVDGRDAILLADEINYGGQYKCAIWNAFAGRGLGVSASQGSVTSHTDGVTATDIPSGVDIERSISNVLTYEGEVVKIMAKAICECTPKSNYQIKQEIPSGFSVVSIQEGTLNGDQVESEEVNLDPLDTVRVVLEARIDYCSAVNPSILFQDMVEGSDMFTTTRAGNKKWVTSSAQFNSASNAWYITDYDSQVDLTLTLNNPVLISGPSKLSFFHRFETEATWDGGVVEISTNNGSTWSDLSEKFIVNGYPSSFAGNGSSNLAGRDAFTGNSDLLFSTSGFIESVVDLADYVGESVLIRFRFASDNNTGGTGLNGWFVDDISFTEVSGFITKASTCQSGVEQNTINSIIEVKSLDSEYVYVDNTALGSRYGGNWSNAFLTLQAALAATECNNIDTIFIAEGTYLPFGQRDTSFVLRSDLVLMGGFPSGGSLPGNRNPVNYLSTLSGDIGLTGNTTDNAYHVIFCGDEVTNATLDGIVIVNGNANGSEENGKGAAIYNLGSITIKNVTTQNNSGNSKVYNGPAADLHARGNNNINN